MQTIPSYLLVDFSGFKLFNFIAIIVRLYRELIFNLEILMENLTRT